MSHKFLIPSSHQLPKCTFSTLNIDLYFAQAISILDIKYGHVHVNFYVKLKLDFKVQCSLIDHADLS